MAGGYNFDEKSIRRIVRSVLDSEKRRINDIPDSKPNARRGFSQENFRLVRGQAAGTQWGTTIALDSLVTLAGGIDPLSGTTGTSILAADLNYLVDTVTRNWRDGDTLYAAYSPGVGSGVDWEIITPRQTELPEFLVKIEVPIAGGNVSAPQAGTGQVFKATQEAFTESLVWDLLTDYAEYLPVQYQTGSAVILNPFPYRARAGLHTCHFGGVLLSSITEISAPFFTLSGFDLLSPEETNTAAPYLLGKSGSNLFWVDVEEYGGIPGDPGPQGPAGTGASEEGYCIDLEGGATVHHDAITSDAGVQAVDIDPDPMQFWIHGTGATTRTDAKWKTGSGYNAHQRLHLISTNDVWEWVRTGKNIVVGETTAVVQAQDANFTLENIAAIRGETPAEPLTVVQLYPAGYAAGQYVMAVETNTPGEYVNTPEAGKVRTSNADMLPEYLADSLVNTGLAFNTGSHQRVYAQEEHQGSNNYRLNFFTDKGGSGTGGREGGYCVFDDTGSNLHHWDPITDNAGEPATNKDLNEQQFMVHFSGATTRQDAQWKTGSGYTTGTTDLMLFNHNGEWVWETLPDVINRLISQGKINQGGCINVVTSISCGTGGLTYDTAQARSC